MAHSQPLLESRLLKNGLVNTLLGQHTSAALLQGSAVSKGTAKPRLLTAAILSLSQPGPSVSRPEAARHPQPLLALGASHTSSEKQTHVLTQNLTTPLPQDGIPFLGLGPQSKMVWNKDTEHHGPQLAGLGGN